MSISERTKELLDGGMDYLERNDLHGFYSNLASLVLGGELCGPDVADVTIALEACGVDTLEYFIDLGFLPMYYLCARDIPDYLISDVDIPLIGSKKVFKLPEGITEIYSAAFEASDILHHTNMIDLRGINSIQSQAFGWCNLSYIIIDESLNHVGDEAFNHNNIQTIIAPETMSEDTVRELFDKSGLDEEYGVVFY